MEPEGAQTQTGAVLFTDLVGFTQYTDSEGDVAAMRVLDLQTELVQSVLADQLDSRVVKELGDGLMLWFGDASTAVQCSIDLRSATDDARRDGSFPLAVRMGMHYGDMMARGDDLIGQTVNVAARISALAGPGELLLSESVLAACADASELPAVVAMGPAPVKGVKQPVWLHRVR